MKYTKVGICGVKRPSNKSVFKILPHNKASYYCNDELDQKGTIKAFSSVTQSVSQAGLCEREESIGLAPAHPSN